MRLRRGWLGVGASLLGLVLGLVLGEGTARATTISLADVRLGDSFVSGNGQLEFSNFSFDSCSCVDPGDITLQILDDGLRLSGPVTASGYKSKSFDVSYTVTGVNNPIVSASLELDSTVMGEKFAKVFATKDLEVKGHFKPHFSWLHHLLRFKKDWLHDGPKLHSTIPHSFDADWLETDAFFPPHWHNDWKTEWKEEWNRLAKLETFDKEFWCWRQSDHTCSLAKFLDAIEFSPEDELRVTDSVKVFALGRDDEATWLSSTNRYSVVPEPTTGALLLFGVAGLAAAGRRTAPGRSAPLSRKTGGAAASRRSSRSSA